MYGSTKPNVIVIPSVDLLQSIINFQDHPDCRDYDLRLANCMILNGQKRGGENCKDLFEDLQECAYSPKRRLRMAIMLKERNEQQKQKGKDYVPLIRRDYL